MKRCKFEKELRRLVKYSRDFIRWMDVEMKKPSDVTRGRRIAQALNALEGAIDHTRYFTLGVDFRADSKRAAKRQSTT